VDIPVDGPAAEVYRTSPEEAWRVIRTKWRVSGIASGPVEGGGRASGYFTGATGITIYRGDAWPSNYLDDAFTADIGSNLIHHKKVRQQGVQLIAERASDEQKVEFITSTDLWFRPAQMANAPDGCLYICDMYREVIEHPWSLPDSIKKLLDLNSGNDRGRIYRIAPTGLKPRKSPQLGKANTATLVKTLEVRNAWHRETASRLLFERQDKTAIPLLVKLQTSSPVPLARMHALHVLEGLNSLSEDAVLRALNDSDATVREHGIKLSEKLFVGGTAPPKIGQRLQQLAADPAPTVRYQLAFTLGELKGTDRIAPLTSIARRDADSFWTKAAILSSLSEGAGQMFANLSGDRAFRNAPANQDLLQHLIGLVGAQHQPDEVNRVLDFLDHLDDPAAVFAMTRALGDGLQRAKVPLISLGDAAVNVLALAYAAAEDTTLPEATRIPAIHLLSQMNYADAGPILFTLLDQRQTQPIQLAALATLSKFTDTGIGGQLIQRWNSFTPRLRAETVSVLLARPDRATLLVQAVQSGAIQPNALDSTQVKLLTTYRDPTVRALAVKVFGTKPVSTRQQVIDTYMPAINMKGDVAKGKKIYEERCISCHRSSGEGSALGPDFVTVKSTGKEKLLTNIIDPNREVRPEYVAYVVETGAEDSLVGLVVNETAASVTLRQAYGKETVIPRVDIAKMRSQGQSLMPEGLEANLTPQDFANLLEYISTATQ
jgi:putative heme-binding domain-containing protein